MSKTCLDCGVDKSRKGLYCKSCGYMHRTRPSGLKYKIVNKNPGWFIKGFIPWNKNMKGIHLSPLSEIKRGQHLSRSTEIKKGQFANELHPQWKGDKVGYFALHTWIYRHKKRKNICEWCSFRGLTDFANLDYEYTRNLSSWAELCKKCHKKYDVENGYGIATKKFPELQNV